MIIKPFFTPILKFTYKPRPKFKCFFPFLPKNIKSQNQIKEQSHIHVKTEIENKIKTSKLPYNASYLKCFRKKNLWTIFPPLSLSTWTLMKWKHLIMFEKKNQIKWNRIKSIHVTYPPRTMATNKHIKAVWTNKKIIFEPKTQLT